MADPAAEVVWTPETAIALLRSEDLSQRYYAAWWLGKMRVKGAVGALVLALQDEEDRTELGGYPLRRNAARSLGKLGDESALPALRDALACDDLFVREASAQAIEEIAQSSPHAHRSAQACIPALVELLESADPQPHEAILEALGQLGAVVAQSLIESFLAHHLPRVRMAAARAMYGLTGEATYGEMLVQELSSPDVSLRRVALADLGKIGYLPAVGAIVQCQVENSFKLFALKAILEHHLPHQFDPALAPTLQEIMLAMDDLL
jgi:phycocyanobilin lyase alpha subunit